MSETPVPVCECREIPDIAQELLRLHACGQLTIHRFETLPDSFKETIDKMMRREIDECDAKNAGNDEYKAFICKHFPHLFA